MATAQEKYRRDGYVCFSLSNKPEQDCFLDEDDYEIVQYNTCWFYFNKRGDDTYNGIRRTLHHWEGLKRCSSSEGLHRFILMKFFSIPDLDEHFIVHINGNRLDNRKSNLKIRDYK